MKAVMAACWGRVEAQLTERNLWLLATVVGAAAGGAMNHTLDPQWEIVADMIKCGCVALVAALVGKQALGKG